jgi:hypothetical protein
MFIGMEDGARCVDHDRVGGQTPACGSLSAVSGVGRLAEATSLKRLSTKLRDSQDEFVTLWVSLALP